MSERTQELAAALVQLQTTTTELHQHNESLAAHYQTAVEEYRRYRAVGEVARRLRQSLEPLDIMRQTVTAVKQLLEVDQVIMYRWRESGLIVAEAFEPVNLSILYPEIRGSAAEHLAYFHRQAGCLVIDDLDQAILSLELAQTLQHLRVQAALIIPILQDNQFLGFLCANRRTNLCPWKLADTDLLQQLVAEVAIAFQQSELYQRTQQLNEQVEQRTNELQTALAKAQQLNEQVEQRTNELQTALAFESMLKRITDRVRDSLDENQILQAAVQEMTLVLGLAGCNASLYDLSQGTSTICYEFIHSIPKKRKVAQMDAFPEIYQQLKQGLYFQFCSLLPNPDRGQVALLACPIFVDSQAGEGHQGEVLGDLWLIHDKDHIFNEFEIRLVQQVANQCAIAIRQAKLYQAAQVQVRELEKLNRLKDEFLSTVSHELRTPIANLKMAIQMLKLAPSDEKRYQYMEILEKESAREAELINDLLDLQRLEANYYPVKPEEIYLQEWIPAQIESFYSRIVNHQQMLSLAMPEDLPVLQSDTHMLRRVVLELLNNACKYTAPGGKIEMKIYPSEKDLDQETPEALLFTIANQAYIPEAELSKIFDKFYRCPNADPWSRGGTGLGLALVQKLVEQLQGHITVQSQDGWTIFRIWHPVVYQT
jgi:signal transduction histidine kinase